MNDYIVLENIPNTPEGRAFLKQLRKYLRPQYKMRSRGRHKDRKGLAKELVKRGIYCYPNDTNREADVHQRLRLGMSCKYADRITTTVTVRNEGGIQFIGATAKRKRGFYLYAYSDREQGPFRTWEAASVARTIMKGLT